MFRSPDLALRVAAALLPPRAGYSVTQRLTPLLGGARLRSVERVVRAEAERILGEPSLAAMTGARFASEIACDDLDAVTGLVWPRSLRLSVIDIQGAHLLPAPGAAVFVSFHFSGGFRVFDVLRRRGFRPTFLRAPVRPAPNRYLGVIEALRRVYLRRALDPPFIPTGKGARERLAEHLEQGGAVVALLDVAPATLDLRDVAPASLLGHDLVLPIGLLRIAARLEAPVIPYAGRIDGGRRVLSFYDPVRSTNPETILNRVLGCFERVVREQPWTWQAWLELDSLLQRAP